MKVRTYPQEWEHNPPRGSERPRRDHRGHGRGGPDRSANRRGRRRFDNPDDGFGPGRRPGRSRARRGDVRGAILTLLADQPANGYGLMKAISEKSEGVWRPSPGSVYPTLQQLVDEGLIAPTDENARRSDYALTEAGEQYVADNRETLDRAWAPVAEAMSERGALVSASLKLSAVVKQVGVVGTPEQKERAAAKLDEVRKDLYHMLAED